MVSIQSVCLSVYICRIATNPTLKKLTCCVKCKQADILFTTDHKKHIRCKECKDWDIALFYYYCLHHADGDLLRLDVGDIAGVDYALLMQHMKRRPKTATNKSYSELHLPGVSKTPPADGPVLSREIYLTKVLPLLLDHREGVETVCSSCHMPACPEHCTRQTRCNMCTQ